MSQAERPSLETAHTPHLDELARRGVSGLSIPVKPGITPGSGPGHLGLFGYDPLEFRIGRGVLEATGIGFESAPARRRHPRQLLHARRGWQHQRPARRPYLERRKRAVGRQAARREDSRRRGVRRTGEGASLRRRLSRTRPRRRRARHRPASHRRSAARAQGTEPRQSADRGSRGRVHCPSAQILSAEKKANGLTLRGFSNKPRLEPFEEVYGLKAAAIAVYPMYKGLARLVGMDIIGKAMTLAEQVAVLAEAWPRYDFFFIHFKYTDSTGEDGNFHNKVKKIEELDSYIPRITELQPTVLIVTGDHSTPSLLKSHSWHPVPTVLAASACRTDRCTQFNESESLHGGLGQFEAKYLMSLALANAGRLGKFARDQRISLRVEPVGVILLVAAVGVIDQQADAFDTGQIDRNRRRRFAAADRVTRVALLPPSASIIDEDAKDDAAVRPGLVVDCHLRLEPQKRPIEIVSDARGLCIPSPFANTAPPERNCPPSTLRSA